jgi:hypothetical protein
VVEETPNKNNILKMSQDIGYLNGEKYHRDMGH